jgi:Lon protease-like protein
VNSEGAASAWPPLAVEAAVGDADMGLTVVLRAPMQDEHDSRRRGISHFGCSVHIVEMELSDNIRLGRLAA